MKEILLQQSLHSFWVICQNYTVIYNQKLFLILYQLTIFFNFVESKSWNHLIWERICYPESLIFLKIFLIVPLLAILGVFKHQTQKWQESERATAMAKWKQSDWEGGQHGHHCLPRPGGCSSQWALQKHAQAICLWGTSSVFTESFLPSS